MNQSFDIHRFGGLFARYWAEWKLVLMLYPTIFVLALFAVFVSHLNPENDFPVRGLWAFIIIGFAIFVAWQMQLVFYELHNRKQCSLFMTLPASTMEKYLFLVLIGFLLPASAYIGMTYLIEQLSVWIMGAESPEYLWSDISWSLFVRDFPAMLFICLIWFTGFLVFRKSHLLFSTLSFGVFMFVLIKLEAYLTAAYTGLYLYTSSPFYGSTLSLYSTYFLFDKGLLLDYSMYGIPFVLLFAIGAFVANYYRFKEKQIKA